MKLLEYIAEKMSGAYGDRRHRLKAFASRISPVHMHAALFRARNLTPRMRRLMHTRLLRRRNCRRYAPAFSIAAASRPSKVEPGSDHGSSQS